VTSGIGRGSREVWDLGVGVETTREVDGVLLYDGGGSSFYRYITWK
jgi:hypothetical protein